MCKFIQILVISSKFITVCVWTQNFGSKFNTTNDVEVFIKFGDVISFKQMMYGNMMKLIWQLFGNLDMLWQWEGPKQLRSVISVERDQLVICAPDCVTVHFVPPMRIFPRDTFRRTLYARLVNWLCWWKELFLEVIKHFVKLRKGKTVLILLDKFGIEMFDSANG